MTSIQAAMLPSCTVPCMVSMAPMSLYLSNALKFYEEKKQRLAQEQLVFVCLKLSLSVEMNETLSPFECQSVVQTLSVVTN